MLFGVKQMSGLRHLRSACRRSRWKYCPAVEGWHDLHVVARAELQIALDAGAGVLRALAFMPVRQQQNQSGQQVPLVFPGNDELVDDDLRAVGEVAELRFPHHQRFGIVARVSVLEAHHRGFGKLGVVDLDPRLIGRQMAQRHVFLLVLDVDQHRVPLIEGAAAAVLTAQPNGSALQRQRTEGQRFGHAEVERTLAIAHLAALLQQLLHLGMDVEVFGIFHQAIGDLVQLARPRARCPLHPPDCKDRHETAPSSWATGASAAS